MVSEILGFLFNKVGGGWARSPGSPRLVSLDLS